MRANDAPPLQGLGDAAAATGEQVEVDIRGKLLPALVVKMPFVRNGKAMI